MPVFGLLCTIAASRYLLARHPDEPWLGWMFVLAVVVKEFASHMRYTTLINDYGQVGDASVYDTYGARYYRYWTGQSNLVSHLDDLRKSNFLRFFTGVVYYLFGNDMIAGFMLFGLIAFVGSYLWYRATVEAIPFLDRRLYFIVIMFVPSILFWPVLDRQGSADAVRDRQRGAGNRAPAQRQAVARPTRRGSRFLVDVGRASALARVGAAGRGARVPDRSRPARAETRRSARR